MSAPETNMILGPTWNIRTELAIDAAEDLRNAGRATYVSRELDQSGKVVKEGECWELQKGKEELLLAFKDQFGQEAEIEVPMNPDAENVITVMEGEDIGALGAWGRAMSKAVGPGDVYEMIRAALHEKSIPVDRVDTACSVTSGNMNRLERIMHATFGEDGKGSLGSYPDLLGSREATHLNCDPHTITSKYMATLTENNISEIWAYKKPEIEIKVTAGGVTLRMPVKLRVTGAGQARDFNAVASGRTERPAMVKDKTMGVGLLKVDLRGGGGGGNEEMRSLVVSGMVM
jgi:DNA-binding protein